MKILLRCVLFLMPACSNVIDADNFKGDSFIIIGSHNSDRVWVYLCGLTNNFITEDMHELKDLDYIGKQANIKFMVISPKNRCSKLNNRLCWPHDTEGELIKTYEEISNTTKNYSIEGYIGFSNGGFFLNKLAQLVKVDKPLISIGSAGYLVNKNGPSNTIYLLIGKNDKWHYEHAVNFYDQSENTNLIIHMIEYEGGHNIPEHIVIDLLTETLK